MPTDTPPADRPAPARKHHADCPVPSDENQTPAAELYCECKALRREDARLRRLAYRIADGLFVMRGWPHQHGTRLQVMQGPLDAEKPLGGWNKNAVRDHVLRALLRAEARRKP